MPEEFYFTSELARLLGVPPRIITDRFYRGTFQRDRCRIRAGKMCIPADYVRWVIIPTLKRAGVEMREIENAGAVN